jgi:hypothetical protein
MYLQPLRSFVFLVLVSLSPAVPCRYLTFFVCLPPIPDSEVLTLLSVRVLPVGWSKSQIIHNQPKLKREIFYLAQPTVHNADASMELEMKIVKKQFQ